MNDTLFSPSLSTQIFCRLRKRRFANHAAKERDPYEIHTQLARAGAPFIILRAMYVEIHLGDVVRLRKKHPCGGYEWKVVRVGADIGLVCQTCGRRVLLPRGTFNKRLKKIVERAADKDA